MRFKLSNLKTIKTLFSSVLCNIVQRDYDEYRPCRTQRIGFIKLIGFSNQKKKKNPLESEFVVQYF